MIQPTTADWGPLDPDKLDEQCAFNNFCGKSFDEAVALFQANALCYQEDLYSMPPAVFEFYAPAFAAYVGSAAANGDSDGASCFLSLTHWVFETRRSGITPETRALLLSTAERVASRQEFYDADASIYGLFADRLAAIQTLAAQQSA